MDGWTNERTNEANSSRMNVAVSDVHAHLAELSAEPSGTEL